MKFLIVLAGLLGLTACAGLSDFLKDDPATAQGITMYATLKTLEQSSDPAGAKQRIVEIAQEAQMVLENESVTMALVEAAVRERVQKLNLSPADTILANLLIQKLKDGLEKKIGEGVLDAEQRVAVKTLLQWVIDATALA